MQNCKKICGVEFFQSWNFHFFQFKQKLLRRIFLIFPVFSSKCDKKILIKKYGVTSLAFKIYAIDGKKWVKFVARQQNSATVIYDLNTMKGTVESYLKKK